MKAHIKKRRSFLGLKTLGFVFELGQVDLKIDSRQNISVYNNNITKTILYTNNHIKNRSGYNCYIILIYLIFIFALALLRRAAGQGEKKRRYLWLEYIKVFI